MLVIQFNTAQNNTSFHGSIVKGLKFKVPLNVYDSTSYEWINSKLEAESSVPTYKALKLYTKSIYYNLQVIVTNFSYITTVTVILMFSHNTRLLVAGTLDEKMYQRQVRKQGLSGAVVDARNSERVHFSTEELKVRKNIYKSKIRQK